MLKLNRCQINGTIALLAKLPPNDNDYSSRWRSIKQAFSKLIPKTQYLSPIRVKRHERGIWQRRFRVHTIANEANYAVHMDGRRMAQAYPPYCLRLAFASFLIWKWN